MIKSKPVKRVFLTYLAIFCAMYLFSLYLQMGLLDGEVVANQTSEPSVFLAVISVILVILFLFVIIKCISFFNKTKDKKLEPKKYSPFKSVKRK